MPAPNTPLTLAQLLVINGAGLAEHEVSNILNDSPFLAVCNAIPASNGTVHSYLAEIAAPVVGFRVANQGRAQDNSTDVAVTINLAILDASFHADKALADAYKKGGAEGFMARESARHLRAGFFAIESQIFQNGDPNGFVGLPGSAQLDQLADAMVANATGAANLTSVYMIRSTPDDRNVSVVMGNDGEISMGEAVEQLLPRQTPVPNVLIPVYAQAITGYVGLQIGSAFSVGRLANVGTAAGTTLTDTLLGNLWDLFPSGQKPTHIVMNRRSLGQLRTSRITALNVAPSTPTEWEGIPILTTEAILNTEAAVV